MVVGAGPCGLTVANFLGTYGVSAVVIDPARDIVDYPRAVGIDDESLRTLQEIGLVGEVLADTIQNTPIRYYTSWGRCFAHVKPTTQPFGWPRRNLFLQPMLEATLRRGLQRFSGLDVRFGTELIGFVQDADGVTASLKDDRGETSTVRAKFLVGADGGRSAVRTLTGVELMGETAPVKWLVVDVADDQLDAPYSAVHCDTRRPVLMVPLPYRHRRWEFKVQPEDNEDELTTDEYVRTLLVPFYERTAIIVQSVHWHYSRTGLGFQGLAGLPVGDDGSPQLPLCWKDVEALALWMPHKPRLELVVGDQIGLHCAGLDDVESGDHAAEMGGFQMRTADDRARQVTPTGHLT